jgi:hypothetical protein
VSNLKQVVSSSPVVERMADAHQRSDQSGQQAFVKHLEKKAAEEAETVQDQAEIAKSKVNEKDPDEQRRRRKRREGDEAKAQDQDDHPDDDPTERHVDVVA